MPTTSGETWASRDLALVTNGSSRRRSTGARIQAAASTNCGTTRATRATPARPTPSRAAAPTTTTASPNVTAARVRSRRVQANLEVWPRSPSPSGHTTSATAARSHSRGTNTPATIRAAATRPRARFTGRARNQRPSNRLTDPAR